MEERGNFLLMVEWRCAVDGVRRLGRRVCLPKFFIRFCVVAIRCHFLFLIFLKLNDIVLKL